MKKVLAVILIVLSLCSFLFTYAVATKEIGKSSILGGDGGVSNVYTPFRCELSKSDKNINNYLGSLTGTGNDGDEFQQYLWKEASKYKLITFALGAGGVISLILGVRLLKT